MKFKNIIKYVVVTIIGIILLNLFVANHIEMQTAGYRLDKNELISLHFLATLYCFAFGILIQWRAVENLITKKVKFKLNLLLIPSLVLLLISAGRLYYLWLAGLCLPFPQGGVGINMLLAPLIHTSKVQNILSVVSGILLIKSFYKCEEN